MGRFPRIPSLTNERYVALLKTLRRLSGLLDTLVQTLIVTFGVALVLVLLLVVEQRRVTNGILLFEYEKSLAHFASFSLVILNMTLEFLVHHVEPSEERSYRWSLRLWWRNVAYIVGIGKDWQPVEHSPARSLRRLQVLVTFAILSLALAGSMQDSMREQPGAWYIALKSILLESTLLQITSWLGGLLFTAAAVMATQRITAYLAVRTREIYQQIGFEEKPATGRFIVTCDHPNCKWRGEYDNELSMEMARRGHQAMHKNGAALVVSTNGNGKHH